MERAVLAKNVKYAVLNLMSDNPGMRWDIETTKRVLGYAPQDGQPAVITKEVLHYEETAKKDHDAVKRYLPF